MYTAGYVCNALGLRETKVEIRFTMESGHLED
jgi:hypothetical protein